MARLVELTQVTLGVMLENAQRLHSMNVNKMTNVALVLKMVNKFSPLS